jgi:hypothetical protein
MNTIFDYINSLPLTYLVRGRIIEETTKDKGKEYLTQERTEYEMKDFPFCVLFVWNKTAEGFDYWSEINNLILDR